MLTPNLWKMEYVLYRLTHQTQQLVSTSDHTALEITVESYFYDRRLMRKNLHFILIRNKLVFYCVSQFLCYFSLLFTQHVVL